MNDLKTLKHTFNAVATIATAIQPPCNFLVTPIRLQCDRRPIATRLRFEFQTTIVKQRKGAILANDVIA